MLTSDDLPKLPAGRQQRALHPDELERLLQAAAADRLGALWLLLARTGLRLGEARALRWSDLDPEAGVLVVQRSLPAGASSPKAPKTAAGLRPVLLSSRLVDVLREHRRLQAEERRRGGARYADRQLVFCTRYGTPLRAENLLRRFRQLLLRAGLPSHYRIHDLRHTAISHQLAAGLSVPEVAASAGHASPAVTTQLYAHAVRRSARSAAEQLEAFYRRRESRAATD
jgi:integrase